MEYPDGSSGEWAGKKYKRGEARCRKETNTYALGRRGENLTAREAL